MTSKTTAKCFMCNNYGFKHKIIEHGIWWIDDSVYVTYYFCNICFSVIKQLWPEDAKLLNDCPDQNKYIEADFFDRRDELHNLIKNNPVKYNKFIMLRSNL